MVDAVAEEIENEFKIRTIFGLREETLEIYLDGIWIEKGRGILKARIETLLKTYSKNNVVNEILEKIKRRSEISREEADIIPDFKRCVDNGVIDLEDHNNIKFLPHDEKYNFRSKFPVKYDPDIKPDKIQKFIEETFYEEDWKTIQEWVGLHLIRRYIFKKAAIIHGPRNTGKTIFVNILTAFWGGTFQDCHCNKSQGKTF